MGLPPLSEVVVILIPLATSSFQKQSFGSLRKNESLACMMSDSLFCHLNLLIVLLHGDELSWYCVLIQDQLHIGWNSLIIIQSIMYQNVKSACCWCHA